MDKCRDNCRDKCKYILQNLQKYPHWKEASSIFKKLLANGHCTYWTGGCVRDALLERVAKDLDIASDAEPDEVLSLFPGSFELGKSFGVVMIPLNGGGQVEVTRFRHDEEYHDGRHPQSVTYSAPREDALRRDFTINALFFDGQQVIDFVGGQKDLERGIIRCVGDPKKRFLEDHLRILRAIRFAVELNLSIEEKTFHAICDLGEKLAYISIERIVIEMKKMMESPHNYKGLELIRTAHLNSCLFGELSAALEGHSFEKIKFLMRHFSEKNLSSLFAGLLLLTLPSNSDIPSGSDTHADGSEKTVSWKKYLSNWKRYLSRWKLSNAMKKEIFNYILAYRVLTHRETWWEAFQILDQKDASRWMEFSQWFLKAWNQSDEVLCQHQKHYQAACLGGGKLPLPLVTGKDLLALGWKGRPLGELLKYSYREQIQRQLTCRKEILKLIQKQATFIK